MQANELILGRSYRLTRDVENPALDRRCSRNSERGAWEAGQVYALEGHRDGACFTRYRYDQGIHTSHEGWGAFVAALEILPETLDDILVQNRYADGHAWILRRLYASGVITREQVIQACADEWNADQTEGGVR